MRINKFSGSVIRAGCDLAQLREARQVLSPEEEARIGLRPYSPGSEGSSEDDLVDRISDYEPPSNN